MDTLDTVKLVIEIAGEIALEILRAIRSGDEARWRPMADVFPMPIKARIERIAQDELTRRELERLRDG
ncbi:MAG: hypothetical protein ABIJ09_24125 [Pseudomonadota bacterium]